MCSIKKKEYVDILLIFKDFNKWYSFKEIQEKSNKSKKNTLYILNKFLVNDYLIPYPTKNEIYYKINKKNPFVIKNIKKEIKRKKRIKKAALTIPIFLIILTLAAFFTSGLNITGFFISPIETHIETQTVEYRKIQEDENFDVEILNSTFYQDETLEIIFVHNSNKEENFIIRGNVSYAFSQNPAKPDEEVYLRIYDWNYDYFELQVGTASEIIAFGREEVKINPKIEDNQRNIVNSNINFKDLITQEEILFEIIGTSTPEEMKVGRYNVTISPIEHPVKEIFIPNFDVQQELTGLLRVDEIPEEYIQFYAIDPSSIEFEYANVTVNAKGGEVYKCEEWDFENRNCEGEWEFMMSITPGEDYTFSITPDDPAFAEVPITDCRAQSETETKGSFGLECDYPDGSSLEEIGDVEEHIFAKIGGAAGRQRYAGVWTNSSNQSITNCDEITNVELCYEWWRTDDFAEDCDVSYSLDGNTWTAVSTNCPGTTANPGVSCINITEDENWTCEDFFDENATGVLAKSEISGDSGAGGGYDGTATWDLLMFNVSYEEVVEDICIIQLSTDYFDFGTIAPGTNTDSDNILLTITNNGTIEALNTTVRGGSWEDGTTNIMDINQTKFDISNWTYENLNYFLSESETAFPNSDIPAGESLDTYWGLSIPPHQPPENYNQSIIITMNC